MKQLQVQYISKPGLLQEALRDIKEFDPTPPSRHTNHPEWNWNTRCTCKDVYKSGGSWRVTSSFEVTTKSTKSHRRTCPQNNDFLIHHTSVVGMRAVLGGFLSRVVEVSVSLTRGAGGFSISPNLTLKSMIRDNSPAFDLFPESHGFTFASQRGLSGAFAAHTDRCLQQLKEIYSGGEASPYDIDYNGRTVLQVGSVTHILILAHSFSVLS